MVSESAALQQLRVVVVVKFQSETDRHAIVRAVRRTLIGAIEHVRNTAK